jgi:2-polyprenyl-6-methoxyphenol hydroxylase-like FAD-dependent oxidoreductase
VVGAGPAGAALAVLLARQGIDLTLVERSPSPDREFRGEGLMPSGLEALARMNLLPMAASIPQRALRGWTFFLEGTCLFEAAEPMGSVRPCTLIDQPALLRSLVAEAGEHAGFRFLAGCPVSELLEADGRVSGVRLADGTQLLADLVVGCDGRGSLVRQRADLPLEAGGSPIDVLWFRLVGPSAAAVARWIDGRFVTVVGATASFALFETTSGAVQLGWAFDPAGGVPAPPEGWQEAWAANGPAELAPLLRRVPDQEVEGPVRLPVRIGCASRWHRPGLLLLGDAAHPMSPVRAQGINMALRDALVAADRLLPALRSGTAAAIDRALPQVEADRRREIRTIQALQRQEVARGDLLRRHGWIRRSLARTAVWSGPLLARRWVGEQHLLRHGLPLGGPA